MNYKTVNNISFSKTNSIDYFLNSIDLKNTNQKYYNNKILNLIKLLLDEDIKVIPPLDEKCTYIIRKRYGIYDSGKNQTLSVIANDLGITKQRVSILLDISQNLLLSYVFRNPIDKISSIEISKDYELLKNTSIQELCVDRMFLLNFTKNNIYTLSDLLTLSRYDLRKIFISKKCESIKYIIDKVHSLNLKFIDELDDKEKEILIKKSNKIRILNSSSWFIDKNERLNKVRKKEKISLNTIKSVLDYINKNNNIIDNRIIDWFYHYGFDLNEKRVLYNCISSKSNIESFRIDKFNFSIPDLLKVETMDLDLSDRTRNALMRAELYTLDKITKQTANELKDIRSLGEKSRAEIVSVVHDLGLFFRNEMGYMRYYSNIINEQLDSEKTYKKKLR